MAESKPRTLTLRLDGQQSLQLDRVMRIVNERTASRTIGWVLDMYPSVSDELNRAKARLREIENVLGDYYDAQDALDSASKHLEDVREVLLSVAVGNLVGASEISKR